MDAQESRLLLQRVVARIDADEFVGRLADRLGQVPAYRRFVGDGDAASIDDRGRAGIRWNLELFRSWLTTGQPPGADDLARLQELVRVRAAEGMPMEEGLLVYRQGARAGWDALIELADDEERLALLQATDVFFSYVNTVTDAFASAYAEEADAATSREERRARELLERLLGEGPLGPDTRQRAEHLGFPLQDRYHPFVAALPGASARRHADLARRLREAGALAATEGRRVAGLAVSQTSWSSLGLGRAVLIAEDGSARRDELDTALAHLRDLASIAERHDRRGVVRSVDHLPELILRATPRHAARLRERVYGPLGDHPQLVRTLDALVDHNFDRSAAAASLPVHRNTLLYRAKRIEELTGLDLAETRDQGLVWLARLT